MPNCSVGAKRGAARLARHGEGRREACVAGGTAREELAAAGRARVGQLVLRLLEVPLRGAAAQADGHPVAEHLAAFLAQPVGGLAHCRDSSEPSALGGADEPGS